VSHHLHTERPRDLGHVAADSPQPHDPDRLAPELVPSNRLRSTPRAASPRPPRGCAAQASSNPWRARPRSPYSPPARSSRRSRGASAAGTSMLSTPVPARAITLRCGARVSRSAVTRVSLRTISASAPASARSSSSRGFPAKLATSTSGVAARRASPPSAIRSATTTWCVTSSARRAAPAAPRARPRCGRPCGRSGSSSL